MKEDQMIKEDPTKMTTYKYELHLHTKEFGLCAKVWAKDIVDTYAALGYDGICVTNHFYQKGMDSREGTSYEEKVDAWLAGYTQSAKRAALYPGFDVILGAELTLDEGHEDYLLYGLTRDLIVRNPQIFHYTLEECFLFAESNGLLLIEAHPFRPWLRLADVRYLHGLEVYNGNPRHDSRNGKALAVARRNGMIMVAGSDYHEIGDEGSAAMLFPYRISDAGQLADALRKGSGTIWRKNPLRADMEP